METPTPILVLTVRPVRKRITIFFPSKDGEKLQYVLKTKNPTQKTQLTSTSYVIWHQMKRSTVAVILFCLR